MKEAIYYPGFEIRSEDWLKFALLYIDHLDPIIPETGDDYLGSLSRELQDSTDLIMPHRPGYSEGEVASLNAMELVGRMLESPSQYGRILGVADFVSVWKDPKNHIFTLFGEKYSDEWEYFCNSNGLGHTCDEGIKVARSLGLIYMSFLAHVISELRGVPSVTDHPSMDHISVVTRQIETPGAEHISIARSVLKLRLPKNLAEVSLDSVIAFRNADGFKARLHAFHEELESWINAVERGEAKGGFYQTRGNAFSEFSDELAKLGVKIGTFGLGVWLLLSNQSTPETYINELRASAVLTVESVIAIRDAWNNTRNSRYTRKYIAALEDLA